MTMDEFEAQRAASKAGREKYNKDHQRCPNCKELKSTTQTYMAYIWVVGREDHYKDENTATCRCGWTGIVHDMLPE